MKDNIEKNPALLRTVGGEFWSRESEPGATSDRRRRNPQERVRTRCNFRQEKKIRRRESELMQQPLKKKDFGMDSKVS